MALHCGSDAVSAPPAKPGSCLLLFLNFGCLCPFDNLKKPVGISVRYRLLGARGPEDFNRIDLLRVTETEVKWKVTLREIPRFPVQDLGDLQISRSDSHLRARPLAIRLGARQLDLKIGNLLP